MTQNPKKLPTTARLLADHAKWYSELNKTARAIADHVAIRSIEGDPELAELVRKYWEIVNQNQDAKDRLGKLRSDRQ